MINRGGKTLEEALAIVNGEGEKEDPPKPRSSPGKVHITITADTTQAAQAVHDLQARILECTEALARIMNVKLEGNINPLEALFYIADVQKEILAELKAIREALQKGGA